MAILVILILVILWAAVLVPPILRSRSSATLGGVSDFMDSLRSLGRGHSSRSAARFTGPVLHGPVTAGPRGVPRPQPAASPYPRPPAPRAMSPMQRRRRNVLTVLGTATGLTLLIALVTGTVVLWLLFLLCAAALGTYMYLLVQFKQGALTRYTTPQRVYAAPITIEDDSPRVGDNVILLRRSAS